MQRKQEKYGRITIRTFRNFPLHCLLNQKELKEFVNPLNTETRNLKI